MSPTLLIAWLSLAAMHTTIPRRAIDRCAQDGSHFYAMNDHPVQVEQDKVTIHIERPDPKSSDAVITFREGGRTLAQKRKNFDAAQGWLTVSPSGAFATTWNQNASDATTQLFLTNSSGNIFEEDALIQSAEKIFTADAKRVCKTPGVNTTAIKWLDDDHLLLSINAWSSGSCSSNFTEGFVLSVSARNVTKKMSEQQLLDLPAVCTWNLVPTRQRSGSGL